jgi:prevent-host-death family protein
MGTKILILTAREMRRRFGEIVARARAGKPTVLTFHGQMLAVVTPASTVLAALKNPNSEKVLKAMLDEIATVENAKSNPRTKGQENDDNEAKNQGENPSTDQNEATSKADKSRDEEQSTAQTKPHLDGLAGRPDRRGWIRNFAERRLAGRGGPTPHRAKGDPQKAGMSDYRLPHDEIPLLDDTTDDDEPEPLTKLFPNRS